MDTQNLLIVCLASFAAVLIILSILALIMHFLLIAFPVKPRIEDDSAIVAAITIAYNRNFPGTKITNIGEQK